MLFSLPHKKVVDIKTNCVMLLNSEVVTVRDVAKVTGRLTACAAAVFSAPLHYRHLQMVKTRTLLANHSYEAPLTLSPGAKQELRWWSLHLETWNGKSLITPGPDMISTTDASKRGGGNLGQQVSGAKQSKNCT